jgi:hypothetical protein
MLRYTNAATLVQHIIADYTMLWLMTMCYLLAKYSTASVVDTVVDVS